MNRRRFLQVSSAAAVGAATLSEQRLTIAAEATRPATAPAKFLLASAPLLTNPSPDGITILCAINGPGTGWVEYGPTEKLGLRADGDDDGLLPYNDRLLSFRLAGLKSGEKYFYRVHACAINFEPGKSIQRGDQVKSEISSFTTLDPAAQEATFTVWNDTHENATTIEALTKSLAKAPTDILVWNGDITNDLHDEAQIINQFIAPAGQPFAQSVPMFLGRGNHDVRGRFARKLPQYINGPAGEYYYTFRIGPVAAIVMDTGEDKPDDAVIYGGLNRFAAYRSRQREWLARAIEEPQFKSAKFKIAFLHIPLVWEKEIPVHWPGIWGDGIKGWICEDGFAKWHDLLAKAGVQLVISGHTHQHAWFPPNQKRPYGQLIGGGPQPLRATSIVGKANEKRLELIMRNLAGEELWTQEFPAI